MYLKINNFLINLNGVTIIKFTKGDKFGRLKFINNFKIMSFQIKKDKIKDVEEVLKKLEIVDISDCIESEEQENV